MPPRKRAARTARGWVVVDEHQTGSRPLWLLAFFAIASLLLAGRLAQVQISEGPSLHAQAVAEHQTSVTIPAQRGQILDSTGQILATDVTVYDVFADPAMIPASVRSLYVNDLAPVLNIPKTSLSSLLAQSRQFVYLAHQQSQSVKDQLSTLNLIGIGVTPSEKRVYQPSPVPGDSFAANLLGFVDAQGNGQYGVEQYYNNILQGTPGVQSAIRDLAGNVIKSGGGVNIPPKQGDTLTLGLDSSIQYWAEQGLQAAVTSAQATSGTIIVMNTHSGSIAAMADYPSYNANNYSAAPLANLGNAAIDALYEPGSLMKVITFAGGLNTNSITPATRFNDHPLTIDGQTIQDWDKIAQGWVTMQWVLDDSLNDGAIGVQQLMGQNAFYDNLAAFGIGAPTGVDLAGEANYPLPPPYLLKMVVDGARPKQVAFEPDYCRDVDDHTGHLNHKHNTHDGDQPD